MNLEELDRMVQAEIHGIWYPGYREKELIMWEMRVEWYIRIAQASLH